MKFEVLLNYIKGIINLLSDFASSLLDKIDISSLLKSNSKGLYIGIVAATLVFILKNNKQVKNLFSAFHHRAENDELDKKVKDTMKLKNVSFEAANAMIIKNELLNGLRITKDNWFINDNSFVIQGELLSFMDKEIGIVQGYFLGIIVSEVIGYEDLYVVKLKKDGCIRQAPISFVEEDSFYVYR